MKVSWGDESIQTRQFEAAIRTAMLFLEHLSRFDPPAPSDSPQTKLWEKLNDRWQLLKEDGDRSPQQYCDHMAEMLGTIDSLGETLFQEVGKDLRESSVPSNSLLEKVSQQAFEELEQCIKQWGGPKAKARLSHLKTLPVHCETHHGPHTRPFFERDNKRILLRVGSHPLVLEQCMTLHFSFFHEYLSHFFPSWSKDEEETSDGFLFALEFAWFESRNTPFESQFLGMTWAPLLLSGNRAAYYAAEWLFHRCEAAPHCAKTFFLEWVATWSEFDDKLNKDLTSQLIALANKVTSRFDDRDKDKKTKELLETVLCADCLKKGWDLAKLSRQMGLILESYKAPKPTRSRT